MTSDVEWVHEWNVLGSAWRRGSAIVGTVIVSAALVSTNTAIVSTATVSAAPG